MPCGYRPAPIDLRQVILSSVDEDVVTLLAENQHNVWARERVKQGWSYGPQQVLFYVVFLWWLLTGASH